MPVSHSIEIHFEFSKLILERKWTTQKDGQKNMSC